MADGHADDLQLGEEVVHFVDKQVDYHEETVQEGVPTTVSPIQNTTHFLGSDTAVRSRCLDRY